MAHWLVAAFDHVTPVPAPLGLFDDVAREDWEIVEGVYRVGVTFGCTTGNSTGGCSFEPESGLVMTSENHPVEVFDYGSEAFF